MKRNRTATRKTATSKPVGQRIKDALEELRNVLESGEPVKSQLTTRTVTIAAPRSFSSKDVRRLRQKLRVSQGVFAQMVGVSKVLVEGWEQGVRKPHPLACRLLEQVEKDPRRFVKRLVG